MNKKGFTLVELLAVIAILAIIAVIVTPVVTGIIKKAKESSYLRSAEGHIKNIEYQLSNNDIVSRFTAPNVDGIVTESDLKITLPDDDKVKCSDYQISEGEVTEAYNCKSSDWTKNYCIKDGTAVQCEETFISKPAVTNATLSPISRVKKGETYTGKIIPNQLYSLPLHINVFVGSNLLVEGDDYTYNSSTGDISIKNVTDTITLDSYAPGIVYFNPVTGTKCSDYNANNSSNKVKTGCMKWYITSINKYSVNLLLDHNTSIESEGFDSIDGSDPLGYHYYQRLHNDTDAWVGVPLRDDIFKGKYHDKDNDIEYQFDYTGFRARAISAEEIFDIMGLKYEDYYNLFKGQQYKSVPFAGDQSNNSAYFNKYGWIFDRTKNDCVKSGCFNNAVGTNSGDAWFYWTETRFEVRTAWEVNKIGSLLYRWTGTNGINYDYMGFRPLITLPIETIK